MAVPTYQELRASALKASNDAILYDIISGGASNCTLKIKNASDALLVSIPLSIGVGEVDAVTGVLTIETLNSTTNATSSGTAAYAEICNAQGIAVIRMPTVKSTSPVRGKLAMNETIIFVGSPISMTGLEIG